MTQNPNEEFPESNKSLYRINGTLINVKNELEKMNGNLERIARALEKR